MLIFWNSQSMMLRMHSEMSNWYIVYATFIKKRVKFSQIFKCYFWQSLIKILVKTEVLKHWSFFSFNLSIQSPVYVAYCTWISLLTQYHIEVVFKTLCHRVIPSGKQSSLKTFWLFCLPILSLRTGHIIYLC